MTLNIKLYTFLFGLLSLATLARGQQTVVNLDSALRLVEQNNPMLQQYSTRAKAQEAYAEGATAWMPPMVGGGVFMMPYPGQENVSPDNKGSLMLSAQQDIPNPAKQRAKQAFYNSKAGIEEASRAVQYNQLRAQVKMAYYTWLVLEKKLAVLEENEDIMEFLLKLAKIRYPYSQSKLGSVYLAEAQLHQVENMQLMVLSNIAQLNVQLNQLMNLPRQLQFQIDTLQPLPEAIALAEIDSTLLYGQRSDIARINRSIESMQLGVKLEELERKPDFGIRFDHMTPLSGMMPQQFTLMGMVSIPIAPWSSKMYRANTKAMNLEIQAMEEEREAVLLEAEGMARSMALELNTMLLLVQNYQEKIIPALRKNYAATLLAYEQNTTELPLVIEAWEALNMAQMEYLDKLQNLYLMAVAYEREVEK